MSIPHWDYVEELIEAQSSYPVVEAVARRADPSKVPSHIKRWLDLAEEVGPNGPKGLFGVGRAPLDGSIMLANQTAITGTSEVGLYSVAQYAGFGPNTMRAGQKWQVNAWGIITTPGASPGNITITPRYGISTGGTSIGASAATALVISATNLPWRLRYDLTIRAIGVPRIVGNGYFLAGTGVVAQPVLFTSTADVTFDPTTSGGIFMGITMGHASDSITTMDVTVESLN